LLLASCGKSKIKTYTMAEKEAYLEKANNGNEEAGKFITDRLEEAEKIYKETDNATAYKEWQEWLKIEMSRSSPWPKKELTW